MLLLIVLNLEKAKEAARLPAPHAVGTSIRRMAQLSSHEWICLHANSGHALPYLGHKGKLQGIATCGMS